jgi:putative flippase GtrA
MFDTIISFSKFSAVGIISTIIHILLANFLINFYLNNALLANFIGFFMASIFSFFGHYYLSFSCTDSKQKVYFRFIVIAILLMFLNNVILVLFLYTGAFKVDISITVAAFFAAMLSFFLNKKWVFS